MPNVDKQRPTPRVLVVVDDPDTLALLGRFLSQVGADAVPAATCAAARAAAGRERFTVAVVGSIVPDVGFNREQRMGDGVHECGSVSSPPTRKIDRRMAADRVRTGRRPGRDRGAQAPAVPGMRRCRLARDRAAAPAGVRHEQAKDIRLGGTRPLRRPP
jgi:CheY-like chemotaxis protein